MKTERRQRVLIASLSIILIGLVLLLVSDLLPVMSGKIETIGVSLVTAGMVSVFLNRIAYAALVEEIADELANPLDSIKLVRHGLRSVVTGPFSKDIYSELKYTSQFIVVQTWCPDLTNLLSEAEQVVLRGGRVDIYLLNPECASAKQRSIDLYRDPRQVPDKIRSDTNDVRARSRLLAARKAAGSLNLFYYSALPAFALYRIDTRAWIGSYWNGTPADKGSTLVLDVPSPMWDHYEKHIRELAGRPETETVPLDVD